MALKMNQLQEAGQSVVLLSKDPPELQSRFANSRGWRFALASHAKSNYLSEQTINAGRIILMG